MKPHQLAAALCLSIFTISYNCPAQTTADLSAAKKAIEKINADYFNLFGKSDMAIVNLYTDDAGLLAPNTPPIRGRQALDKDFKDTFAAGKVKGVKFITTNVYGDGANYLTEEGTWQVFEPNGKLLDDGKYLKLWKRTKAGWKIFRDLFNSNRKG